MLYDRVFFATATAGTGTITTGLAEAGFRTMLAAGIPDGTSVEYAIIDGTAWETGTGTVGATATTLTRTLSQSSTSALLILSGTAKCFLTPIASQYNTLKSGTVTSVSVATANGVSGSVLTPGTTPAITITLGAITPTSVAASGAVTGSNLSGTNTGDQTSVTGNAGTATALSVGADRAKLDGITTGATANSSDAFLLARGNHSGTQGVSTILAAATGRFFGRITAAGGAGEELSGTQATTLLDPFTSALKGLVPSSGGGTTNFLRADGTFAAPAGGGSSGLSIGKAIALSSNNVLN